MSRSPVRIGVLGLDHWYWATSFIPQVLKHPGCRLAAIWEPSRWRLKATKYAADRVARDPREITDSKAIDLVVSFLPCPANARWLARAAAHGKAVISNKPVAMTPAQAAPLLAALRRSRRPSFSLEGTAPLTGRMRMIRGLIRRGAIGRPLTVSAALRGGMPMAWWDRGGKSGRANWGWWTDPRLVPGGAWIDHSIYAIPEIGYLLGDAPRRVQATMAKVRYPNLGVEDYGTATYTYRRGAVVTMEYDWIGRVGSWRLIAGTKGSLNWGKGVPDGKVALTTGRTTRLLAPPKATGPSVLEHVLDAVRTGRPTVSPVAAGVENLRVALAAYRAARAGRALRV